MEQYLKELEDKLEGLEAEMEGYESQNEPKEEEPKEEPKEEEPKDEEPFDLGGLLLEEPVRKFKVSRKPRVVTKPYMKGATEKRRRDQLEKALAQKEIDDLINSKVEAIIKSRSNNDDKVTKPKREEPKEKGVYTVPKMQFKSYADML